MSLFETEDEWKPDWFENEVNNYANKIERDIEDRENSGFSNRPDQDWQNFKQDRKDKNELEWERKNRHLYQ